MTLALVTRQLQVHACFTPDDAAVLCAYLCCGAHEGCQEASVRVRPHEWLTGLTAQRVSSGKVRLPDLWRVWPVALLDRVAS